MTIRVVRMLEYTYETPERMVQDMAAWQLGANSHRTIYKGMTIKSSMMLPEIVVEGGEHIQ